MTLPSEELTRRDLDKHAARAATIRRYTQPPEAAQYYTDGPACTCGCNRWAVNGLGETWCCECKTLFVETQH